MKLSMYSAAPHLGSEITPHAAPRHKLGSDPPLISDSLPFSVAQVALGCYAGQGYGLTETPAWLPSSSQVALGCYAGQGYGLTETCSVTAVVWPDRGDMFGTVGPVQTCIGKWRVHDALQAVGWPLQMP